MIMTDQKTSRRMTLEISDDLRRAIILRGMMQGKTQKEVILDALTRSFKPELKMIEDMEKGTKNEETH